MTDNKKRIGSDKNKSDHVSHCSRILLAEDDLEMRKLLAWPLHKKGYEVAECADGNCIMKKLGFLNVSGESQQFDLIISDIRLPGITGLQVLESAKEFDDFPPMILITAFPDQEIFAQAQRLGAVDVFAKPFDVDDLLNRVMQIIPLTAASEKPKQLLIEKTMVDLLFPLEVTFRHHLGSESVKVFVQDVAAKLNRLAEHIIHCHVVIDQSDIHTHRKHYYNININLTTAGKTIVVKHDSDTGHSDENLYLAIHIAFGIAWRDLKNYLRRHNRYRSHG